MNSLLQKPKIDLNPITRLSEKFGIMDKFHDFDYINWNKYDVALIAFSENNNFESSNEARKQLYDLYSITNIRFIDLGNTQIELNNKVFINKIYDLFSILKQHNIALIYFADTGAASLLPFNFFNTEKEKFSNLTISSTLPYSEINLNEYNSSNFLNYLNIQDKFIENNIVIGLQKYLVSNTITKTFNNNHNDTLRLSEVQADFLNTEPYFRKSNIISFNYSAIKYSDAPGATNPQPNGFSAYEFCKLANYAGLSDNLNFFGLYGYQYISDNNCVGAKLIAQTIWHFLNALARKKELSSIKKEDYTSYFLNVAEKMELKFNHCKKTDRWWLVIFKNRKEQLIPCSFKDYDNAKKSKFTKRISNFIKAYNLS